jgi:DNA-binding NarL/FixJ family response regulator
MSSDAFCMAATELTLPTDDGLSGTRVLLVSRRPELAKALRAEALRFGLDVNTGVRRPPRVTQPHVVVLDEAELDADRIRQVRAAFARARILVVAALNDELVLEAFRRGVHGWITPWEPVATIAASLLTVSRGGVALSLPVLQLLLRSQLESGPRGLALTIERGLSARQVEVLQLAARGLSDRRIAETLSLSTRTVNRHMSDALRRLDCATRFEAIELVFGGVPPAARMDEASGQ